MNYKLILCPGESGMEATVSPDDLRVRMVSSIYERGSTAGYDEVPQVQNPTNRTVTNRMIQTDQPWGVSVNWTVNGNFACLLSCGHWKAKVIFELMGGGENTFSPQTITQDMGIPGRNTMLKLKSTPAN